MTANVGSVPTLDPQKHLKTKHIDVPVAALVGTPASATAIAVQALISAAVNALVNGAPGALNTLKELADALGDDQNFAATIATQLNAKLDAATAAGTYSPLTDTLSPVRIDFTTKPDGGAPTVDDAGTAIALRYTPSQNPPTIVSGKLVANPTADTAYATYTQIPFASSANGKRIGADFTVAAQDSGQTGVCLALWDHDFPVGTGANVPQTRAHAVYNPGNGAYSFWVGDGSGHLVTVTGGVVGTLVYDNAAVWRFEVFIDEDAGDAYMLMPDSQVIKVTASQIATTIAGTSGWTGATTLKGLSGKYAMLEHYCSASALTNTNAFPRFLSFWAEAGLSPRARRWANPLAYIKAISRSTVKIYSTVYQRYAPSSRSFSDAVLNSTTTLTSATAAFTTSDVNRLITGTGIPAGAYIAAYVSATQVTLSAPATATTSGVTATIGNLVHTAPLSYAAPDATNLSLQVYAGGQGKVLVDIDAYYDFTAGADTVFWSLFNGATRITNSDMVASEAAGVKRFIHHQFVLNTVTAGTLQTVTFQHQSLSAKAQLQTGFSSPFPSFFMRAIPL